MIWESIVIAILLFVITGLTYQFLPASFELIAVILGIGFALYLIITIPIFLYQKNKKKNEKKVVEKEVVKIKKVKDELTEIKDYIKYNLYYGQKKENIESELLKQGWTKEKVDKAFSEYNNETKTKIAPKKQPLPQPNK